MQLVGATKGFIQRPFIITGISHGIFASMLAVALLTGFLYLAQQQIPELIEMQDLELLFSLLIGILLSGVVISYFSTYLAVRKYLRLKTDELYY
jgi:cell division transport system permease protein